MIYYCNNQTKLLSILFSFFALAYIAAQPIPVWIDTDPAAGIKNRDVDDGLALLQAFHSPELKIIGISVVFGNASLAEAFPIAQSFTKNYGPAGLSVYKGAASGEELGQDNPATKALAAALEKQKLTILALGPVTNVATVIKNYPHVSSNIEKIIAVAGRRPGQRFQTGTKNPKAHRDFNFELDPEGFQIILNADVPLVLAPFEISSKVWMTAKELEQLEKGNAATQWLAQPARVWLQLWQQVFAVDGFNPFDTLAIAYLTSPQWIISEELPVEIQILPDDITEEQMQGTKTKEKPYLLASKNFTTKRKTVYCYNVTKDFKADLMQRLLSTKE